MNLRSLSFFPSFFSFLFFFGGGATRNPAETAGARWLVEALAARANGALGTTTTAQLVANGTAGRECPIPLGFPEPGRPWPKSGSPRLG
jgi:hypothetical protein